MKHISYLFLFIISIIVLASYAKTTLPLLSFDAAEKYKEYTTQWVTPLFDQQSVVLAGEEDLHIILNLLYLAAARSQATIQAQESSLIALQKIWEGWTNIITRRRNPSKPVIYTHASLDVNRLTEEHTKNLIVHEKLATLYDIALEQTLKNGILENLFLLNHLTFLRDYARRIMLQAALDIQPELDVLAKYIETKRAACKEDDNEITKSNFIEYLLDNIQGWSYQSFIAADKLFVKTSEYNWSALYTAGKITNSIWEKLEHARGTFYATLYQELYRQAELHGITPMVVFNEHGLISTSKRKTALPQP